MLSPLRSPSLTSLPLKRAVLATGFQTKQRLIHIKATLAQNNITDLAALGNLQLGDGRSITPTPGILIPPNNVGNAINILYGEELLLSRVNLTQISRLSGFPSDIPAQRSFLRSYKLKTPSFRTPVLPFSGTRQIPIAYWVADEIEITNNTTVVFTNICEELYIIANKIKLGTNVQFTWQEPDDHSRSKGKLSGPLQPRQNKRPDTEDQVIHGSNQVDGKAGERGDDGINSPRLEIWTLDFEGSPRVLFKGQDGQPGQDGQDGSKGQNGADGIGGKLGTVPLLGGFFCDRKAGSGGDGAPGGKGGNGGDGGDGGKGGSFTLFAPQLILNSIASYGLYSDLTGGDGGASGRAGRGGEGGEGGSIGQTARSVRPLSGGDFVVCGPKTGARNGREGHRGIDGQDGRKGEDGSSTDGAIRLVPIDENEFRQQLSKPAIQKIQNDQVIVGDQVTIQGLNFSNTDKVLFDNKEATPSGITGSTIMTVVVPSSINGGNIRVSIRQSDGALSNPYTIVVKPKINSITQSGQVARFKPGQDIIIRGSGFSQDSTVLANNLQLREVVFVGNTEIRAKLVRPFQENEFPNASGEPVSITVRIPATRIGVAKSNALNITLDTFRMIVVGDSIQWGQGLQEHQKMHTLVENEIKSRAGNIGVYKSVFAHSGAIIGADNNRTKPAIQGEFGGEVNDSFPTIREQVLTALNGQVSDDTIDLVLMDGGINDVGITTIIDPLSIIDPLDNQLEQKIDDFFHGRMKELLKLTSEKFPSAKIIVTGYFQIISDDTDGNLIGLALTGFGLAVAGFPGVIGGLILNSVVVDKIKKRCSTLKDRSHTQIVRAITETMNELTTSSGRMFFADPLFLGENSIFSPKALLFGINTDLSPEDNDLVANARKRVCDLNSDRADPTTCAIASIGHPNPAGARKYADSVISQIRFAFPELFV